MRVSPCGVSLEHTARRVGGRRVSESVEGEHRLGEVVCRLAEVGADIGGSRAEGRLPSGSRGRPTRAGRTGSFESVLGLGASRAGS